MNTRTINLMNRPFATLAIGLAALTTTGLGAGGHTDSSAAAHRTDVELMAAVVSPRLADDDFDPNRQRNGGAYGPYTCKPGFVWRDSYEGDHLCVTPADRKKAHDDNPDRQPGGGVYGPYTCKPGFVWRDSYDGDYACVTPQERAEEKREAGRS